MTKTSDPDEGIKGPIDMSLRFWSDDLALEPLLKPLGMRPGILHTRGELIHGGRGRLAKRHYASVAVNRSADGAAVGPWIMSLIKRIRETDDLVKSVEAGLVEAVFWIAVLGPNYRVKPYVEDQVVDAVAALGAAILLEDYVDLVDGNPAKLWLTAEPGIRRAFA